MIKLVGELKDLAIKKAVIEKQIKGIESRFFERGIISFEIKTNEYAYDREEGFRLPFNKELMLEYLSNEQTKVVDEIEEKIKELEKKANAQNE